MNISKKINLIINNPLVQNFISLNFLQVANYILPLITLPYLVRVLGPDKFGLLAFYQSFNQFFLVFIDYGFNYTATREISINRENRKEVAIIYSSVLTIKFYFALVSLLIITTLIFFIPIFKKDWLIIYLTLSAVIAQSFFPRWFFQGYENMKYITIITVIAKLIFTLLIFIVVIKPQDFFYVPMLNAIGFLISFIISIYIIQSKFNIAYKFPSIDRILTQLRDGWHLFLSTVASSLYSSLNSFILGLFTSEVIVGYYAAAEKIVKSVQDLFTPIFHATYPHLSKRINEDNYNAKLIIKKILKYLSIIALLISIILLLFASNITHIILGDKFDESVIIVKILSFIPFLGGLNIVINSLTLLSFNLKKQFSFIVLSAGIFNILCSVVLIPFFGAIGSGVAMNLSELLIFVSSIYVLNKNEIFLFSKK